MQGLMADLADVATFAVGAVYRLYDADDRLLYVGCTTAPRQRLRRHARNIAAAHRWEMDAHPSKRAALWAEYQQQLALRPTMNKPSILGRVAP